MSVALLQQVRPVARDLAYQLESLRAQDPVAPEGLYHQVQSIMQHALDRLAQTGCWGSANRIASNELWRIAGTQLSAGSLLEHARAKPRGYAGDFEMLEKIESHYLCQDPLGQALDRFFQQQAAPEAVRNRMHLATEAMIETMTDCAKVGAHLVSVGSGPALDVARALAQVSTQLRHTVRVTLIDIDPAALENAATRLQTLLPANQLTCIRENLFRLSKQSSSQSLWDQADLISCPGLFDYLDDDHATAMLTTFWQQLSPHGTLLVFNFAPTNPSRAFMEWMGQWHLIYRDTGALGRLAERAGMHAGALSIEAGPLGICPYIRATMT